jgi:predicted double-glycine peptidase
LSGKANKMFLNIKLSLVLLIIFLCYFCFDCQSAESNPASYSQNFRRQSSGGYCGIYCLYATIRYFGIAVEPIELIKPEYIGSLKGSSLAELKKAAKDHGLYAVAVSRFSTKDLRRLTLPVILHVKSSPTAKKYEHYELFLGSKQNQSLIYDQPNLPEPVEFWSLAPIWDGSALIVSNKPINLNSVFVFSRLRFAGFTGIIAAGVFAVRFSQCRFRRIQLLTRKQVVLWSFIQCSILILASALIAFAYHSINDEGLLKRPQTTKAIQLAYQPTQNNVQKASDNK